MDLSRILHWRARRILKTTPGSRRGSDGQVQEDFSAIAGPAGGQCKTRSAGGAVHRAGGAAVRSGDVLGYGGLRAIEGRVVAARPWSGAWHTESRYVQPGVPPAQARGVRTRLPPFHGSLCQGQWAQPHRGGGNRRQGLARRLRTRQPGHATATGQRLCGGCPYGFGSAESAWSQRDGGCLGGAGASLPRRLHRYRRCAALPSCVCGRGSGAGRRLCASDQSQSWPFVQGGCATICPVGQTQQRRADRQLHPRPARSTARDRHAQCQLGCHPPLSRRCGDRPDHLAQAPARQRADPPVVRHYLLSKYLSPKRLLHVTRSHWGIENRLHWVLDVHFAEDGNRARKDNAPENLAILRRLALNILRTLPDPASLRRKIKRAGWDDTFLMAAISHMR
jgi:predicted transposase YbfD/YdcC